MILCDLLFVLNYTCAEIYLLVVYEIASAISFLLFFVQRNIEEKKLCLWFLAAYTLYIVHCLT